MKKRIIKEIVIIALFLALLIVSTFIRIPMPFGDYLTLQLEVVILIGFILGPRLGTITCLLYMIMGLIGIPVFAAGGGITYFIRPSFGYIYGFVFASFIVGLLSYKIKKKNIIIDILIAILGIIVIYIFGYIHKYFVYLFSSDLTKLPLKEIILATFSFEVPKDLILGSIIGLFATRLKNIYLKIYQS